MKKTDDYDYALDLIRDPADKADRLKKATDLGLVISLAVAGQDVVDGRADSVCTGRRVISI